MYKYEIFREAIISGSLEDFRALMHEIFELQPKPQEDRIFLQGERTPSEYPKNMGRWEVTLGGTLNKRGYVRVRQLPNGTTKLQFTYYSKYEPIGPQFDVEFVNQIMKQTSYQFESVIEESRSINENRRKLHQGLIHHFNRDELRTIAFEMDIRYENFSDKLNSFARELIEHCERHQCIEELIEICQRKRPQATW